MLVTRKEPASNRKKRSYGVRVSSTPRVEIGDTSSTNNVVLGNVIGTNKNGASDFGNLGNDGVTANDARDPDPGPNALQNVPVLTSATRTVGTIP